MMIFIGNFCLCFGETKRNEYSPLMNLVFFSFSLPLHDILGRRWLIIMAKWNKIAQIFHLNAITAKMAFQNCRQSKKAISSSSLKVIYRFIRCIYCWCSQVPSKICAHNREKNNVCERESFKGKIVFAK